MGGQTGFSMRLQNRANLKPAEFEKVATEFIAKANATPGIKNVFTTFSTSTPQIYVDVDRDKAQMLKVPLDSIFEALRVYLGSAYVNDFNMFGRTYRVTAQADSDFRVDPQNVARIRVRNEAGQMVPLGNLVTFRNIAGPDRMPRYNLFPTVEVNGSTDPGISSGETIKIMADLAGARCPRASPTNGPTCRIRRSRPAAPATTSSSCRWSSCSWRWPPSSRAGRCRSPSSSSCRCAC